METRCVLSIFFLSLSLSFEKFHECLMEDSSVHQTSNSK